jgi:hypothetical protein
MLQRLSISLVGIDKIADAIFESCALLMEISKLSFEFSSAFAKFLVLHFFYADMENTH